MYLAWPVADELRAVAHVAGECGVAGVLRLYNVASGVGVSIEHEPGKPENRKRISVATGTLVKIDRETLAAERQRLTEANGELGLFSCLIVAAQPASAGFIAAAANRWGWETFVCTDADAAKAWLENELPQLAFVDLQGPGGQSLRAIVEQVPPPTKACCWSWAGTRTICPRKSGLASWAFGFTSGTQADGQPRSFVPRRPHHRGEEVGDRREEIRGVPVTSRQQVSRDEQTSREASQPQCWRFFGG